MQMHGIASNLVYKPSGVSFRPGNHFVFEGRSTTEQQRGPDIGPVVETFDFESSFLVKGWSGPLHR